MKKRNFAYCGFVVAASLVATNVSAAITGQVDVKLNVSSGCTVDNSSENGGINKFGTLDFGKTASTWENILTAEVASSSNGGDITVTCDSGVSGFNVSVDGGEKGDRQLSNGTDNVPYNVYQDAARSKLYEINTPVAFATSGTAASPVKIPLYGAVPKNTNPVSQGDYKDTLLVTVTF
jgi:spore coat protein U-like protein